MSHNRGNRKWLRQTIWEPENRQHTGVHPIICSECPAKFLLPDRHTKQLPFDIVERRLREAGWTVGKTDRGDLCPACTDKEAIKRRQKRSPVSNVVPIHPQPTGAPMNIAVSAPNKPTPEERRTIFIYLNDIYVDQTIGYQAPWTDKTVAEHLNVPLAWVSLIRDENFGPARDNSEIRGFLTEAQEARILAADLLDKAQKAANDAYAAVAKLKEVQTQLGETRRLLDTLSTKANRIEKAVTP